MNVPEDDQRIGDLSQHGVPFALTRRVSAPGVSFVAADDERGGYPAATHLIRLGHRRIGYLGGPAGLATTRPRRAGYRRAMGEAGVAVAGRWTRHVEALSESAGHAGARRLLAAAPALTAMVTADGMAALGAALAAQQLGRRVPDAGLDRTRQLVTETRPRGGDSRPRGTG
jgi:LacI family transcriptional regulator